MQARIANGDEGCSRRAAGSVLTLIAVLILCLVLAYPAASTNTSTKIALLINPNTSGPAELQLLSGIGPKRAEAIIDYRESHDSPAFDQPADLQAIHGIGPVTATRIGKYLSF